MRIVLIFTVVLMVACSADKTAEESVFFDDAYMSAFIKEMDKRGIPYKVDGRRLLYDKEFSNSVSLISSSINENYPAMFRVSDLRVRDEFVRLLEGNEIPYRSAIEGEGYVVIVEKEFRSVSYDLFNKVK